MSIAKKFEDNILHVMTALVITPPFAVPKTPESNLLDTLPKAPNALVIK